MLALRSRRAISAADAALRSAAESSTAASARERDAADAAASEAGSSAARAEATRRLDASVALVDGLKREAVRASAAWEVERQVLLDEIHLARMRASKAQRQLEAAQQASHGDL